MLNAPILIILNNSAYVNPFHILFINFFVKYHLTALNIYAIIKSTNKSGGFTMATGERIRRIRTMRGMTLKYLGESVGFPENTADIRMAQYESGTRTPKADLTEKIASALDVVPETLAVPDIESYIGVIHTLFALEDNFGLKIDKLNDEVCIRLDKDSTEFFNMVTMFKAWEQQAEKLRAGEITKEEYDNWRYNYPCLDKSGSFKKIKQL